MMIQRLISTLIMLLSLCATVAADVPHNYYTALDGKKKEALKTAAHEVIRPHTVVTYNSLFPTQFPKTDVYPELYNGQKRWWEMYSDNVYYVSRGWSGMNREHSFPKSWWGGDNNEAYTDLFHLYPSESDANMAKSNYPLGEVEDATFDNGVTRVGYAVSGQGGGAGKVFEPADEYKGDFARTYFYVVTAYQDFTWKYTYMAQQGDYPTLKPWAVDLLLDWHRRDPVSQKEIDRNEAVYKIQGNRNPFIDFAELAEYIWGSRTSETFYIADQGGAITPPITGDPELVSPAENSSLDFGQVAIGSTQTIELLVKGVNLSSALSIRVTGTDRAMFTLEGVKDNQIPASKVNSDEGYRLAIRYAPTMLGKHVAAITLYDGGFAAGKTFNVVLSAEALEVPQMLPVVATAATDVTDSSYVANWIAPEQTIDYYIVHRTRYLPSGEVVTSEIIAEESYLLIEDRAADVSESYEVQSVRLGYKSELSNTIQVAKTSSVAALDDSYGLRAISVDGGVVVRCDDEVDSLTVYDISGVMIKQISGVASSMMIDLLSGVYFIVAPHLLRPVKVIVR
ncbi:MAG: endonuclease [Muribaculaceae bacterium]|nr:endonuclease [Muribaculaceae bacterium]